MGYHILEKGETSQAGQTVPQSSYLGASTLNSAVSEQKANYYNIDLLVWIVMPILFIIAGTIGISIGKSDRSESKRIKFIYLAWFLALVAPPVIIQSLVYFGVPIGLSQASSYIFTIVTKLLVLVITFWAGRKLHFRTIWSFLLSLLTLAPFGAWLILILLLSAILDKKKN